MKCLFVLLLSFLLQSSLFSQNVTLNELIDFVKKPVVDNEQYLHLKGFSLYETRKAGNNDIKSYKKGMDFVLLGWTWKTKDNETLHDVTYMTTDQTHFIFLFGDIKDNFEVKNTNRDEKGRTYNFENNSYTVMVFLNQTTGDFSTIKIMEKP